jgi:hypothetical protein
MTERYKNGKIYKLVSDMTDDIYIGSCCVPLYKRLHIHKHHSKLFKEGKVKNKCSSFCLFQLGGEVKIILLEEFPTDSKEKLLARERFHIENNKCLNLIRPIVFEAEKKNEKREYERTEAVREKKREYERTEAVREKKREYERTEAVIQRRKEKNSLPNTKAKQKEYNSRPEVKARRAEQAKERRKKKAQLKTLEASAPSL